ncbi:hypothetical protein FM101_07460 [Arthrobacter rhombi]|uniref:Uncharacterized protein n=1 Tax=Arthrobacter rhombi TaxID=71253 RepID=A0A1R4G429_9MICC|nr:hypothetical protein FM101_07460 [Arthrobacter rhombi]
MEDLAQLVGPFVVVGVGAVLGRLDEVPRQLAYGVVPVFLPL